MYLILVYSVIACYLKKNLGCKYFIIINSIKRTMVLNIPIESLQLEGCV